MAVNGFSVSPARFRKFQGNVRTAESLASNDTVEATLRVNEQDYIPEAFRVRSRIDPFIVTGTVTGRNLTDLDQDPKVITVSIGRALHLID